MIYIWTINAQYHWEKKKTGYYQTALDMEIDFGSWYFNLGGGLEVNLSLLYW